MRVLITGVQGYVGSRLAVHLADRGMECDGCDPGLFSDCRFAATHDPPIPYRDVRELTESHLQRYDAVVHLAGVSNDPFGSLDAAQVYDPTREYSQRLAALCAATGTKLVFASSCSVYGRQGPGLCDEGSAPNPQTPYSQNKLDIENDLVSRCDGRFPLVILRFATAFGLSPRMRFDIVINMLAGMACSTGRVVLNSNGLAWRPHVDIRDMCQAMELSLLHAGASPLLLNVGGRECNLRILDVAEKIRALVPGCELEFLQPSPRESVELIRDRKIQDGVDSRTYRVSFERIRDVFPDFECRSVDEQIAELVEGLRKLGLTRDQFEDPRFYRLQRYEWLMEHDREKTHFVTRTFDSIARAGVSG